MFINFPLTVLLALFGILEAATTKMPSDQLALVSRKEWEEKRLQMMQRLANLTSKGMFYQVKIPTAFHNYDLNDDGYVTKRELATVSGTDMNLDEAFRDFDQNGDGFLSRLEFRTAPWRRETPKRTPQWLRRPQRLQRARERLWFKEQREMLNLK